jgi:hypothetical protein
MPTPDSTAKAALGGSVIAPAWFLFLDFDGDPLRATTYGPGQTFSGTGDADLDGHTFTRVPSVIEISEVTNSEGGSDTRTVTLSGLPSIDTDLMTDIGNVALWRLRTARIWCRIHDASAAPQGAIFNYDTGYMVGVDVVPSPNSQVIRLKIENYLAAFSQASNRTYGSQGDFDPADTSYAATIGAANGNGRAPGGGVSSGASGGTLDGGRFMANTMASV